MGRVVIVAYRAKPDRERELLDVVAKHLQVLSSQGLVTDRPAYVMRAGDGTVLQVFEWRSADAIAQAHGNPMVQALWGEFAVVCDFVPLNTLAEASQLFAEFNAIP